jgi:hypothetical protein
LSFWRRAALREAQTGRERERVTERATEGGRALLQPPRALQQVLK